MRGAQSGLSAFPIHGLWAPAQATGSWRAEVTSNPFLVKSLRAHPKQMPAVTSVVMEAAEGPPGCAPPRRPERRTCAHTTMRSGLARNQSRKTFTAGSRPSAARTCSFSWTLRSFRQERPLDSLPSDSEPSSEAGGGGQRTRMNSRHVASGFSSRPGARSPCLPSGAES